MKYFVLFLITMMTLVGCENAAVSISSLSETKLTNDIPSLTFSVNPSAPTNSSTLTVFGSCSDDKPLSSGAVQICMKSGSACVYPEDFNTTADCAGGVYSATIPSGLISADGLYDIEAVVTDSEGLMSLWAGTTTMSYMIDRTAPAKPTSINRLALSATEGNQTQPTVDVQFSSIQAGDVVRLYSDSACAGPIEGSAVSSISGSGVISVQWMPSTALTNGSSSQIFARAQDLVGNLSPCSGNSPQISHLYTYDITPPTLSLSSPSATLVNSASTNVMTLTYSGAVSSTLAVAEISLVYTGGVLCTPSLTKTSSFPSDEVYTLTLSNCTGNGTVQVASVAAANSMDRATNLDAGISSPGATITVNNVVPGDFAILGVFGNLDILVDANLNSTLVPTIRWDTSSNADNYNVAIYENDGTTVKCSLVNTSSTTYTFTGCNLTAGLQYKIYVQAVHSINSTLATNNIYSFFVNRPPSTNSDVYYVNQNSASNVFASLAATPQSNDSDPDSDTLTITAVDSTASSGSATLNSGVISFTPTFGFHGYTSITYTVTDGRGGFQSASIFIKVVGSGASSTWTGAGGNNLWSTPANWCSGANSALSGCASSNAPTTGTRVLFDNICQVVGNCNVALGANATISSMDMNNLYTTGTFTKGIYSLILNGAGGFSQSGGTFNSGSGAMTVSGGPFNLTGGTFLSTSAVMQLNQNVNIQTGSTFIHNSGTVRLISNINGTSFHSFTANPSFHNFTLGSSTPSHMGHNFQNTSINVLNELSLGAAATGKKFLNGNINFLGSNLNNYLSQFGYGGNGVINFVGSVNQSFTLTVSPFVLPSIRIQKSVGSALSFSGYHNVIDGDFEYVFGDVFLAGSTVSFGDPNSPINQLTTINAGSLVFDTVNFSGSSFGFPTLIVGSLNVNGPLTFNSGTGQIINGGRINAASDVYFINSGANGTTELAFVGSNYQTLTSSSPNILDGKFEVDKSIFPLITSGNLILNGAGQDFVITNGTVNLGGNLTVSDQLRLETGTVLNRLGNSLGYLSLTNNGLIFP